MPAYSLKYFDVRGLGEPIRWIFLVANVPFEDNRLPCEDWEIQKGKTDWGQMPILEVDGRILCQSAAIGRYLAQKFNLLPTDDWEAAKCDEIVNAVGDLRSVWQPFLRESKSVKSILKKEFSEERHAELKKDLLENHFPRFLPNFNKIVKAGGGTFLFGDRVCWADFFLANFLELWEESVSSDLLEPYPSLRELKEAVLAIPQIKEWVSKRPNTFT